MQSWNYKDGLTESMLILLGRVVEHCQVSSYELENFLFKFVLPLLFPSLLITISTVYEL